MRRKGVKTLSGTDHPETQIAVDIVGGKGVTTLSGTDHPETQIAVNIVGEGRTSCALPSFAEQQALRAIVVTLHANTMDARLAIWCPGVNVLGTP